MHINFSNMYATHIQSFNFRLLYFLGYRLTAAGAVISYTLQPSLQPATSYPLN